MRTTKTQSLKRIRSSAHNNTMSFKSNSNAHSGFTLLEVMVALAIFALAAMAFTKVAMQYIQSTEHAQLRTKAEFVAMNEAALMQIYQQTLTGQESKRVTSQGQTWQVDKRAEPTISADVRRIDIQISLVNPEQDKVEAGIRRLVFFNANAGAL